jgi:predicted lipoprotein with Yx(FWY)xxD motif
VDTDRTTLPVPDRPRATPRVPTAAARLVAFVAALALIAAVGWQVGRMVAPDPLTPAAVAEASAEEQDAGPAASEHQGDQHQGEQQGQAPQQHHGSGGLQLWAAQTPALGTITLDGAGRIVYRSDADGNNPPVSRCTGECALRWVPLTVSEGQEPDLLGIKTEHFGTFRREDGALQVTLAGWPLYTVAGDQGGHDGSGSHGAEGLWFAVTPTGEKATP